MTYILEKCDERHFRKGEILLEEEKVCRHVWFIKKGLLRAYQANPSNPHKTSTCWFMMENDVATSVRSFFRELPSEEVIIAEEDTVVFQLSKKDLFAGIEKYRGMAILTLFVVINYYCDTRFNETYLRMKEPQFIFQRTLETRPDLLVRALQADLASFLGVSDPLFRQIKSGKYRQE